MGAFGIVFLQLLTLATVSGECLCTVSVCLFLQLTASKRQQRAAGLLQLGRGRQILIDSSLYLPPERIAGSIVCCDPRDENHYRHVPEIFDESMGVS